MNADAAHKLLIRLQTLVRAWGVLRAAFEHHEAQEELRARTLPAVAAAMQDLEEELRELCPRQSPHQANKAA